MLVIILGTDEYGELVHSTIYPNLVTNVPKEVMEYPDYTFKHHFGRALPSYVDAACIREYLDGLYLDMTILHYTNIPEYFTKKKKKKKKKKRRVKELIMI